MSVIVSYILQEKKREYRLRCRDQELKYLKGRKYLDAGELIIKTKEQLAVARNL